MRLSAAAPTAAVMLALVLSGCSLFRTKDNRPCPTAGIVGDLAKMDVYRDGGARDLTDLRFTATLAEVGGSCKYDRRGVEIEMVLAVVGERGPAMESGAADVEYFVAITAPDQRIVAKQTFRTTIEFGNKTRSGSREELVERIPLPAGEEAGDYAIAVGFQLTPEQIEENRRRRGR